MRIIDRPLWTWTLPDRERKTDPALWRAHGGKWIVFGQKEEIMVLSEKLAPFIQSGQVESAKYWNRDPSAICVYALDREKKNVADILKTLGAPGSRVWEYDYAWDKNIQSPINLAYSQLSKFRTILKSYGCAGTLGLMREFIAARRSSPPSGGTDDA